MILGFGALLWSFLSWSLNSFVLSSSSQMLQAQSSASKAGVASLPHPPFWVHRNPALEEWRTVFLRCSERRRGERSYHCPASSTGVGKGRRQDTGVGPRNGTGGLAAPTYIPQCEPSKVPWIQRVLWLALHHICVCKYTQTKFISCRWDTWLFRLLNAFECSIKSILVVLVDRMENPLWLYYVPNPLEEQNHRILFWAWIFEIPIVSLRMWQNRTGGQDDTLHGRILHVLGGQEVRGAIILNNESHKCNWLAGKGQGLHDICCHFSLPIIGTMGQF